MRKLLREMAEGGRLDFNDLCAATALFRPGPLDAGLCDRYVQVKQGVTKPYYEHPRLVPILEKTLGVMAYQEQTMKVAQVIAGFTPGEADLVRKAIGKKDAEKMAELGGQFVAGAVAGYAEVELEDGTKVEVHRLKKLRCADGKLRTIDEALAANADVLSFT
jgi:DNA polymerase-3 subunit alpha